MSKKLQTLSRMLSTSATKEERWVRIFGHTHPGLRSSWGPGEGWKLTPPLKFGANVRNCTWRLSSDMCHYYFQISVVFLSNNKRIYHLNLGPFPHYIALTISTISRCGVKINVSHYAIKLDIFGPNLPPVERSFLRGLTSPRLAVVELNCHRKFN